MNAPLSNKYDLLDRLAEEFAERFRRGERPALTEYIDRHPDLADEIRELFPTLVEMERVEAAVEPATQPLLHVGDYRILREIGRGGMGVVYEAEQISLGRRVALKVLPRHTIGNAVVRQRFHREARAAAQLHHTNIVPVFEVGEDDNTCWYAMQLILGQGLDQIIEELGQHHQPVNEEHPSSEPARPPLSQVTQSLVSGQFVRPDLDASTPPSVPPQAALHATESTVVASRSELPVEDSGGSRYYRGVARIGRQVAEGLAHAHARGIIHRDIKPSNVLLDTAGVAWITDFGLAKTHDNSLTTTGDIVGTLRYMAPERFKGEGDERTDVYGLGLTLYELLVFRPAFVERDRLQLIDRIKSQEPARPRLADPRIPRDLETIVLKAIHKEPKQRYQTAEALAEDLRRFLANEPIKAKRTSHLTRLRLWGRRNPALAALLLVLTLVAAASTATAFYLRTTLAESESNLRKAEEAEREGKYELWRSYLTQARAERVSRQPSQRFASLRAIQAALALSVPPGHSRDELRTEAIAALCLPDLELYREGNSKPVGASGFTIDPAFQRYAWADREGNVRICRLSDDKELLQLPGGGPVDNYGGLPFSPNGRFLHQMCNTPKGIRSRLWDLDADPKPKAVVDDDHNGLAFQPDGREVAVSYRNGTLRFLDTASWRELRRFTLAKAPRDRSLLWNPKLLQLLVWTGTSMHLLNVDTGASVEVGPKIPGGYSWTAWHPEGRLMAVGRQTDRKIYLWDVPTGRLVMPPLEDHKNFGVVMRFNHAGDRLLSTDWSDSWHLWDTRSGRLLLTLPGDGIDLSFSPDDLFVGTVMGRGTRLCHFRRGEELRTLIHASSRRAYESVACLDPEGRLCAIYAEDGIALVDVARGEETALLPLRGTVPLCFDAEGALWSHGGPGLLRWPLRVDAKTGQRCYGPPKWVFGATKPEIHGSSTDARIVAMPLPFTNDGAIVLHTESKRLLRLREQEDVRCCAVSPDGRWVATGSHELHEGVGAKVWDARDGHPVKDLPAGGFCFVRFSPGGKWLLTMGGGPRLWAVGTWQEGPSLNGTSSNPWGAFLPDDKLLALGDKPGVIRLIVPDTAKEIARLTVPEQTRLRPCCFTPDGTQLIAVGLETTFLYIFDLRAIRAGLAELDLDWEAPPLSAEVSGVALAPRDAAPLAVEPLSIHFDLGDIPHWAKANALVQQAAQQIRDKQHGQALESLRKAIRIAPSDAVAHKNLSLLFLIGPKGLRDPAQALLEAKKAIELSPIQHEAWFGYAELCLFLGQEEEYRRNRAALLAHFGDTTDPFIAERVSRACLLLPASGEELTRAAALADRAVAAEPKHVYYGCFLADKGLAEYRLGRFDSAIDWLQQADARGARMPVTRLVLAMARQRCGQTQQARDILSAALQSYDWSGTLGQWPDEWIAHVLRREAEPLVVVNLSAFLDGKYQPHESKEQLELIEACRFRKRYLAAARLYTEVFAAEPKLAADPRGVHRYNAACTAALAGTGQGHDAGKLKDEERARLLKQALDWLRDDLAMYSTRLQESDAQERNMVQKLLERWQRDDDLLGIRAPAALAKLPADERASCARLWVEVEALLRQTRGQQK